jgi:hypothetical protein
LTEGSKIPLEFEEYLELGFKRVTKARDLNSANNTQEVEI